MLFSDTDDDSGKASDTDPPQSLSPDGDGGSTKSSTIQSIFNPIATSSPTASEYHPIHVSTAFSPSSTTSDLASSVSTGSTVLAYAPSGERLESIEKSAFERVDQNDSVSGFISDSKRRTTATSHIVQNNLERKLLENDLISSSMKVSDTL